MRKVSFSCVFNFFTWKSRLEKSKKVKVPGATEPQPIESSVIQSIPRNFYLDSCSERAQVKEYEVTPGKPTLTPGEDIDLAIENCLGVFIEYKIAEKFFYAINIAK